ncbi:MAG: hypothetical protein QOF76_19 [Solirubrobacteraceae bacterium]|jgi:hypothetical protein|nr:hypothetical protein [Solirubrobacteraceae bacterium]
MISLVSLRQLKPGTYEEFRKVWQPDPWHPQLQRVEIFRNDEARDQVLTVSYVDATAEELDTWRDDPEILKSEARRIERICEFEDHVIVSGIFEMVEEVTPPA